MQQDGTTGSDRGDTFSQEGSEFVKQSEEED
jgi:hypothetical protein